MKCTFTDADDLLLGTECPWPLERVVLQVRVEEVDSRSKVYRARWKLERGALGMMLSPVETFRGRVWGPELLLRAAGPAVAAFLQPIKKQSLCLYAPRKILVQRSVSTNFMGMRLSVGN